MSTPKDWVIEARERCEAATPGPWRSIYNEYLGHTTIEDAADQVVAGYGGSLGDSLFQAHSRTDLPRALDVIEAADRLVRYLGMAHVVASVKRDTNPSNAANVADLLAAYRKVRG